MSSTMHKLLRENCADDAKLCEDMWQKQEEDEKKTNKKGRICHGCRRRYGDSKGGWKEHLKTLEHKMYLNSKGFQDFIAYIDQTNVLIQVAILTKEAQKFDQKLSGLLHRMKSVEEGLATADMLVTKIRILLGMNPEL